MSTYSTPDRAELNFHTGVMLRHQLQLQSFTAHHIGIQFSDEEEFEEDIACWISSSFMLLTQVGYSYCPI